MRFRLPLVLAFALSACQQNPAPVAYHEGGSRTASTYNDGPVYKTPNNSVPASRGSAGSEAARYYKAQPQPASRVIVPATAPRSDAGPRQAAPFAAPSRPLTAAETPAAPVAQQPPQTFYRPVAYEPPAPQAAPMAAPVPAKPAANPMVTALGTNTVYAHTPEPALKGMMSDAEFQAALGVASIPDGPLGANPYQGAIRLGPNDGNAAAPSLPPAKPVQTAALTPRAEAAPKANDFVINAQGDTVKSVTATATPPAPVVSEEAPMQAASSQATAVPVSAVSSAPLAGSAPMVWPVHGTILSNFGPKKGGKSNDGINIAASAGTPIHAAEEGMVIYAGNELPGYGNMVVLAHADGRSTVYAHALSLMVKKGDPVKQGALIGRVGATGGVKQPQLHFAVREGNKAVDPLPLLEGKQASR